MKKPDSKTQEMQRLIECVRYECASGVHTYHGCECGRRATRRGRCALCLLDDMDTVIKKPE